VYIRDVVEHVILYYQLVIFIFLINLPRGVAALRKGDALLLTHHEDATDAALERRNWR